MCYRPQKILIFNGDWGGKIIGSDTEMSEQEITHLVLCSHGNATAMAEQEITHPVLYSKFGSKYGKKNLDPGLITLVLC